MSVEAHGLTLALVALLAVILATGILPEQVGEAPYSTLEFALMGLCGAVLLFASVVAHELAHAAAARATGERIERVVVFLHGSPGREEEVRTPWKEFAVAAAGPAVTLLVALGSHAAAQALEGLRHVAPVASFLAVANLLFGLSFLLPALPLDGGRMLRATLWGLTGSRLSGTRWACWLGRGFAAALALACVGAMAAQGFSSLGLWGLFLALALWFQSGVAWRATRLTERLRGLVAADVLEPAPKPLPRVASVADALVGPIAASVRPVARAFLVEFNGRLGGIVPMAALRGVAEDERHVTPVGQVATRLRYEHLLSPGTRLETVMRRMAREHLPLLPVVQDGRLVGVVSRDAILDLVEGRRPAAD